MSDDTTEMEELAFFIITRIFDAVGPISRSNLFVDSTKIDRDMFADEALRKLPSSAWLNNAALVSSTSGKVIERLVEDGVLMEFSSDQVIEELAMSDTQDDQFTSRNLISQIDNYWGASILGFGPNLHGYVVENFSKLIEYCDENNLDSFKNFCFSLSVDAEAFDKSLDRIVISATQSVEIEEIMNLLEELQGELRTSNDLPRKISEIKDLLIEELELLKSQLSRTKFRLNYVVGIGRKTLNWIAEQSAGAAVGAVAMASFGKIIGLV